MMNANELRESVQAERHERISTLLAAPIDLEGREWYLPLAGREHVAYPSQEAASRAAVRLCVILGVPICTPLSREGA